MWYRERPKQLSIEKPRRICPACRTLDPPTESAYGCPECGKATTLSEFGGEVPEVCPWCGDGKLEKVTDDACAVCGRAEVEEREVYTCPWCERICLDKLELQNHQPMCPKRPQRPEREERPDWTPGGEGKVIHLRLTCRGREDRPRIWGTRCKMAWHERVARYAAGDKHAFDDCIFRCAPWKGRMAALVEVESVEPYMHQVSLKIG